MPVLFIEYTINLLFTFQLHRQVYLSTRVLVLILQTLTDMVLKKILIILIYWYQLKTSALIISDLWITSAFEHHMVCDTKSDHQMGVSDPAILIIRLQINGSSWSSIVHFIHVMVPCHGNSFHITGPLCVRRIHWSLVDSPNKGPVMWDWCIKNIFRGKGQGAVTSICVCLGVGVGAVEAHTSTLFYYLLMYTDFGSWGYFGI